MTAPAPQKPDDRPGGGMMLIGMRIWIACALIIVASGLLNYVLTLMIGSK